MTEFNCPKLQKIADDNQYIIDAHIAHINALSADIKSLDNMIASSCFRGDCMMLINKDKLYFDFLRKKICFIDSKGTLDRPLIECPLHIRLKIEPHLTEFLNIFLLKVKDK
jgi:hypothetical protein